MDILTHIFVVLVAIEFVYIFYLETIATTSKKTSETFGITKEVLEGKNVNVLLKNQGVYNLLIAVMLLIALFIMHSKGTIVLLLNYIIIVAAYGAVIFFFQHSRGASQGSNPYQKIWWCLQLHELEYQGINYSFLACNSALLHRMSLLFSHSKYREAT
jgi:putative membrane protein